MKAYKERSAPRLNRRFTELIDRSYSMPSDKWKGAFAFGQYADMDNMAPVYLNMLETIKEWMAARTESDEALFAGFKTYTGLLGLGLKYLDEMTESNVWFVAVIKCFIRRSKRVLLEARSAALKINKPSDKLLEALFHQLRDYRSSRTMDKKIKDELELLINNLQVSICFSSHEFSKCQRQLDLIRRDLAKYSQQELNNFYFQYAKMALINCKFVESEDYFQRIRIQRKSQLELIMRYLIPCKIFLGKMPVGSSNAEYLPIIEAIVRGDFETFERSIQRFQKLWIKRGIYLVMEKMRILVWRNFVKRTSFYLGEKIEFEHIVKAVSIMGGKENISECMCVISNLIYEGYVRGFIYFTEGKRTLVLKKGGAFPNLLKIAESKEPK